MNESAPFTRRAALWLYGIGIVSFLCAVGFAIFGADVTSIPTADNNSYSRSALGHEGFVRVLRELGVPVVQSQNDSGAKAGAGALLLIVEPRTHDSSSERFGAMLDDADTTLVVLPKWTGQVAFGKPTRLESVELVDESEVQHVLTAIGITGSLVRPEGGTSWAADEDFDTAAPSLDVPQLLDSPDVTALIQSADGALLSVFYDDDDDDEGIYIPSDPDLLANHGLRKGDNAILMLSIIDALRGDDGAVIVDETLHGYQREPTVWRALLDFPLVLATVQALLTVMLLLWAATGRFGAPWSAAPLIEPGKEFLIDNTATLLHFGGHVGHTLERYYQTAVRDVARRLHASDRVRGDELSAWLERVERARGVGISLRELKNEIAALTGGVRGQERRILLAANRLYRWKQEMLHGPSGNSINQR